MRGILYGKTDCTFQNKEIFLNETLKIYAILILLEMSILLELRFERNI